MRDDTAPSEREVAVAYLDAIRLGLEGADSPYSAVQLMHTLLANAPTGPGVGDTLSPQLLIEAIRTLQAEIVVPA